MAGGRWCGQRAAGGGPGARRGAVVRSCSGPQRPERTSVYWRSKGRWANAASRPGEACTPSCRLCIAGRPGTAARTPRKPRRWSPPTCQGRHRCPLHEAHRREGRRLAVALPHLTTDIDNVNEADTKPKPNRTNQQQAETNNNKNITNKNGAKSETNSGNKPGVRFIADSERPASAGGLLETSKKSDVVRPGVGGTILGHRRQSSLDSGCSLDMSSSSSSSGKGSPDPVAPTLTPPPEFADTPIMERRRRSRRRHTSGASTTGAAPGTLSGSPGVGAYSAVPKVLDSIPRIPRAKETTATTVPQPSSPEIHINFRILPRAKARGGANASGPSVSRSESCRPFSADGAPAPAFKTMSWDRHLLSSPSDRYLDDSERRCRSLSRPGRLPFSSHEEGSKRDPEWLEIARRRQATGVDWENFETRMKQPQSISCSNLSESHMRGKVSTLASADRAGLRLVRSASALYPRIKMSRFERRMRRENPNPSPERRRSSDEFVLVSSSSSDAASAGASSTEDEKPSFLNVQLRHVEKAPPLNVVFQTRGGGGGGVGVAVEPTAPRAASPTLTWKSHREDNVAATTPSPTRLDRPSGASARAERAAASKNKTASESMGVAEYLTPKKVELIEAPAPATKKDTGGQARGSPTRALPSDHVSRGAIRGGPPLRRSSSVQMRSREVMSTGRASPWDTTDSAVTPSWILEAERKKRSGIDWARLDKSLSQTGGKRVTNLSSECLHQPTSATEVVPDWLKEIRKKKQEDASIRLSRSSEDILNEANVIDSATPRPHPRSPTEALRKTPPIAAQRSTEQPTSTEVSGGGSSIPPPPPMPPSDFWSKPKEVWFKQQVQKPGAGVLVAPVCQRDS
nr:serine/arginine repetitive matrix protein 2-like isoform X2 [Rhipicephalus microplus]